MPISVPPYMPIAQQQRPNIDIAGSIGGLGDALIGGLEYGQKRKSDKATRAALAEGLAVGPNGLPDYMTAAGRILQGGGDPETALTLARLAEVQAQNAWQRRYQPDWHQVGPNWVDFAGGDPQAGQGTGQQPAADSYSGGQDPYSGQQGAEGQPQQQAQTEPGLPTIQGQPEPPKTITIYKDGQPQIMQFNPDSGQYDIPLGGTKAPAGTGPKAPTIDAMRNKQLLSVVTPELATIEKTFTELSKPENQAGALLPGGVSNYATSAGYQQGRNALRTIIASYLYSMSGATANPGEVETQTDVLMPRIGEADTSVADKLKRIRVMVDSIKTRSGGNAAAEGEIPPDEQIAGPPEEPQGEVVEMGGKRYMMMPDGSIVELD